MLRTSLWSSRRPQASRGFSPGFWLLLLAGFCCSVGGLPAQELGARAQREPLEFSDLEHLGVYRLRGETDPDGCRLAWSMSTLAFDEDGRLWVAGNPNKCFYYAPFELPAEPPSSTLDEAPIAYQVEPWTDITQGRRTHLFVPGALRVDGEWLWTTHEYYNADESRDASHGYGDLGPWLTRHHSQLTAGYLAEVPMAYRSVLGCRFFGGLAEHAVRQKGSYGPAFVCLDFDPNNPPGLREVIRTTVLEYVPLREVETPSGERLWETKVRQAAFIDTGEKAGVVFVGFWGYGRIWYGPPTGPNGEIDPCSPYKGRHAEKYDAALWIYDPEDLVAVKRGKKSPRQIEAREKVLLDSIFPSEDCVALGGVAWHEASRRLYVSAPDRENVAGEPHPVLHVFEVH